MNLTLQDVEAYQNQGSGQKAGKYLRFYCPVHGGDNQRSFQVNPDTGHYKCHTCSEWGYLQDEQYRRPSSPWAPSGAALARPEIKKRETPAPAIMPGLGEKLIVFQKALPGSMAELYLKKRGILLDVAQRYGLGYSPCGSWPGVKGREWKGGRLVFPHMNPAGEVVNLYGRAVGEDVPKADRHMHLSGAKGAFNAAALTGETVYLCEGAFDAISLIAAGKPEACAIFGVGGLRWEWLKARRIVFCFDQDGAGEKWRELASKACLLGFEVFWLPKDVYQGHKDLNEAWAASGRLDLGEWVKAPKTCLEEALPAKSIPEERNWPAASNTAGQGAALEPPHMAEYGLDAEQGRPATKEPEELRACSVCRGSRYWKNLGGNVICGSCHPPGSPGIVAEWIEIEAPAVDSKDPDTEELIVWFNGAELPGAPFELWPWAKVADAERFFSAIRREISQGPGGLRYGNGLLHEDLRRLRALFGDKI